MNTRLVVIISLITVASCNKMTETIVKSNQKITSTTPETEIKTAADKLIWDWDSLEDLFDKQIKTLKDRGCPKEIIYILEFQKGNVIYHAQNGFKYEGVTPFIPVIPLSYRSVYDLIATVRYKNEHGQTRISSPDIADEVETPKSPYFIFNVDGGSSAFSKDFVEVKEEKVIFKNKLRIQLTLAELIAVATHTDVISKNTICATASQNLYGGKKSMYGRMIPVLVLYNDVPSLGANTLDVATKICTFPTALYRD